MHAASSRWKSLWLALIRVGTESRPLMVNVGPNSLRVHGLSFRSAQELEALLRVVKPAHLRIVPTADAEYAHVHGALEAVQRAGGANMGLIGNERFD